MHRKNKDCLALMGFRIPVKRNIHNSNQAFDHKFFSGHLSKKSSLTPGYQLEVIFHNDILCDEKEIITWQLVI